MTKESEEEKKIRDGVLLRLHNALSRSCTETGLMGSDGVVPSLKSLDFDLKTLTPEKQHKFVVRFIEVALEGLHY